MYRFTVVSRDRDRLDGVRFVAVDLYAGIREHAGHAMHTIFVDDIDALVEVANRGIEPSSGEPTRMGCAKATDRDADGNEIGFGGA